MEREDQSQNLSEDKKSTELVDKIIQMIMDEAIPNITKLVVHKFPDDDSWLCLWIAKKFIPKTSQAEIVFVNAGESLPNSSGNRSVLHFDTGGGEYDQHTAEQWKTASATILVERLELLLEHPGLKPLLEMVEAVDNIKPLPPTSIHFAIEGYPRQQNYQSNGTINWEMVQTRVFELFDIIYRQETVRIETKEELKRHGEWTTLSNGIRVCNILWHPRCREAAFEIGAHAVVWTQAKNRNRFYTGIQINRNYPLFLDGVAAALRVQESKARGESIPDNLRDIGRVGSSWYLHPSKKLILNGSRTHEPTEEEYTRLVPRQIIGLVNGALSAIPRAIVNQWH